MPAHTKQSIDSNLRIAGTAYAPLDLFKDLAARSPVTCAENRVYNWLLRKHWLNVSASFMQRSATSAGALRASFLAGSQLLVEYTGNPQSHNRRIVMVAHTDCEGYVLQKSRIEGNDLILEGFSPTCQADGTDVEEWRNGTGIEIYSGLDEDDDCYVTGVLGIVESLRRDMEGGERLKQGAVVIRATDVDGASRARLDEALKRERGTVTAVQSFVKIGYPQGVTVKENGEISAYGVDNAAGVAVATSVLTDLVLHRAPVNASVLYTSGEEAGFIGLLECIEHLARKSPDKVAEWTWLVVDSSDQSRSKLCRIDQWLQTAKSITNPHHSALSEDWPLKDKPRCPLRCASVRLGDREHYYEPATARLLYQAALQARQEYREIIDSGQSAANSTYRFIDARWLGTSGVFQGGFCETYVLQCLDELIRSYSGAPSTPDARRRSPTRFGSVAIPVLNYRHRRAGSARSDAPDGSDVADIAEAEPWIPQPEKTHVGALNSSFLILRQACQMHGDYYEVKSHEPGIAGFRYVFGENNPLRDQILDRKELVEYHIENHARAKQHGVMNLLNVWVKTQGAALAANVGRL